MKEIEAKILNIDQKKVEQKLVSLGARKVFEGLLEACYFDFKDSSLKKQDMTLRLRKENEKAVLTLKKKVPDEKLKIRNEYEIEVSDFKAIKQILERLGLLVFGSIKKKRITYTLEDVHFELDKYLGNYSFVPEFLEIESEDESLIYKYARMLGFKPEDCMPWTMVDVIKHYQNKKTRT